MILLCMIKNKTRCLQKPKVVNAYEKLVFSETYLLYANKMCLLSNADVKLD